MSKYRSEGVADARDQKSQCLAVGGPYEAELRLTVGAAQSQKATTANVAVQADVDEQSSRRY